MATTSLKKLALVDFSKLQIDVLIAQLYLAVDQFELHVISTPEVIAGLPQDLIQAGKIKSTLALPTHSKSAAVWAAFKQLKAIKADYAVMNDGQGNYVKWLSLLALTLKTEFIGVHHNADKFIFGSFTQKLILLKMKKYFVLADYIIKNLKGKISSDIKLSSFYISQADYKPMGQTSPNELVIGIPGFVEFHRRDYLDLIKTLANSDEKLSPQVKFVILGNSGKTDGLQLIEKVKSLGLENNFIFYHEFVPLNELYRQVDRSDLLMTLIGPKNQYFDLYKKYKISGTYSLSIALNKPILLDQAYADEDEFNNWALFYESKNLVGLLNQFAKDKTQIAAMTNKMKAKFDQALKNQCLQYGDFILSKGEYGKNF